jgi:NADPH:quinone reductase-like Zn-dependent oxidoreductase
MKAAIRVQYGRPESLSIQEVAIPVPKDHEVLVQVFATTVNRTDCAILTGKPLVIRFFSGLIKPRFPSTGTDFAGKVTAVGKKVTKFAVGDRVWGFNDTGLGSHAQYIAVPENMAMLTIPEGITYEQAAASAEGAHYAYYFLSKVKIAANDKVLVNGATGAIGSATVQFLKYFGAHVTAVCSTEYIETVKGLGADVVIDYTQEDFTIENEKYRYVFDSVGKSTFAQCKPILEDGGIYMSSELGPGMQNTYLPLITTIKGGKKVKFPIPFNIMESLVFIKGLLETNQFRPLIDRRYPLEQIEDAFYYVNSGQKKGNVLITFEEE